MDNTRDIKTLNVEPKKVLNVFGKIFKNNTIFKKSILIAVLLLLWQIVPSSGLTDKTFLPPLSEVIKAWWKLLLSGELINHISASLIRAFSGFAIAIAYGIPLGMLIGWYKGVSDVISPVIEIFRNTAALALFPLFILFLGIGETSKIAIVVYACSWPILLNTIAGVKNVDNLLIRSAQSMGVNQFTLFRKVIFPAAIPTIFTGIRLAGATSILVLVAAEMIGAKAGLGYLIQYTQFSFQIPNMYAGIITISLIGLIINKGLLFIESRFSSWKPQNNN
ncbi:MAG: ABC transporter permease [Clostridium sp.]|uniref:ABC transporter permease n=1 Tax=Clostridium sp. TaxID=1506 RepID=UPI0039ED5A11